MIVLAKVFQTIRTTRVCIYIKRDLLYGIGSQDHGGWQIHTFQAGDPEGPVFSESLKTVAVEPGRADFADEA